MSKGGRIWRLIPPEGWCCIGCAAALLFFWVTQPQRPEPWCTSGGHWFGLRVVGCRYGGPVAQVRLPSGELVAIWPGHVFAPSEGYEVTVLYDQVGGADMRGRAVLRQPSFDRPYLEMGR